MADQTPRTENCRTCDLTYPAETEHRCTDRWTDKTPATEAGRRLNGHLMGVCPDTPHGADILAIEAEARAEAEPSTEPGRWLLGRIGNVGRNLYDIKAVEMAAAAQARAEATPYTRADEYEVDFDARLAMKPHKILVTRDELGKAIEDHVSNEYGDEGYDHETSEVTYYDHKCSDYCAVDILRRLGND